MAAGMSERAAAPHRVRQASVVLVVGGALLIACPLAMDDGYRPGFQRACGLLLCACAIGVRRGSRLWRNCACVVLVVLEVLLAFPFFFWFFFPNQDSFAGWQFLVFAAAIVLDEWTQRALLGRDAAAFFAPRPPADPAPQVKG